MLNVFCGKESIIILWNLINLITGNRKHTINSGGPISGIMKSKNATNGDKINEKQLPKRDALIALKAFFTSLVSNLRPERANIIATIILDVGNWEK